MKVMAIPENEIDLCKICKKEKATQLFYGFTNIFNEHEVYLDPLPPIEICDNMECRIKAKFPGFR